MHTVGTHAGNALIAKFGIPREIFETASKQIAFAGDAFLTRQCGKQKDGKVKAHSEKARVNRSFTLNR